MKREEKNRKNIRNTMQKQNRNKKRRRRRARNKVLSILLLLLAAACIVGIFYMGQALASKSKTASEVSVDTGETAGNSGAPSEGMLLEEAPLQENAASEDVQSDGAEADHGETEPEESLDVSAEGLEEEQKDTDSQQTSVKVGDMVFHGGFQAEPNADTVVPSETDVLSSNSILIDLSTDTIVAEKDAKTRIYPASMTKILTILVAAEHVTNLDDTFTMTSEITAYCLNNGCSAAGFVGGETIPVRDLFYGTILPSGGEAAVGLATYVAGSQEAFVELMNQKLETLGLSDTSHFTNCVGIYDDNHYCTAYDMAMILKAAVENDFCREVLSAHVYTTTLTEQNPEGLILSNWFLRRIEDKDCGGEVLCAKTGFVAQSGDCAASYGISAGGKPYICVTVNTYSSWRCIYDHVAMYKLYAK